MKTVLIAIAFLHSCVLFAENLLLSGKIGIFPIEMTITNTDWSSGEMKGKYRYLSKTKYITLVGQNLGNCYQLTETVKGEVTGTFYLQREGDTLTGKWLSLKKHYDVQLVITSGDKTVLKSKALSDFRPEVSENKNGTYHNASYFLNDMFLTDQNIEMEIGYNGGSAIIVIISEDSILFQVNAVCGPTYHLAFAEGIAVKSKKSDQYTYTIENEGSDESCIITIEFNNKEVTFEATGGFNCGFGARAYLSHTFLKTSETIEFDDDF